MESVTDLVEYNYEVLASIAALFGKVFWEKIQQGFWIL